MVVAVVADGAGSARCAEAGARIASGMLGSRLLELGLHLIRGGDEGAVKTRIVAALEDVRDLLSTGGRVMADHHCTVVACLIADDRAFVCQLGDSIALASAFDECEVGGRAGVDFFPDHAVRLHAVERGEYANETHFVTSADWRRHLRISAFDMQGIDTLLLMTDGAMDVAITGGRVYRGFLSALVASTLNTPERPARDALLARFLSDPGTDPLTSDDKTLFLALRADARRLSGRPVLLDESLRDVPDRRALPVRQPALLQSTARLQPPPGGGTEGRTQALRAPLSQATSIADPAPAPVDAAIAAPLDRLRSQWRAGLVQLAIFIAGIGVGDRVATPLDDAVALLADRFHRAGLATMPVVDALLGRVVRAAPRANAAAGPPPPGHAAGPPRAATSPARGDAPAPAAVDVATASLACPGASSCPQPPAPPPPTAPTTAKPPVPPQNHPASASRGARHRQSAAPPRRQDAPPPPAPSAVPRVTLTTPGPAQGATP